MANKHEYFGKYILLEKMAAGGMAEVFLARAPGAGGIGKFVAIKRILPQFSDHKEFIDMFKDEAKIAINLSHSNIVSIYEFGVETGAFFLVMDYVKGKNVRQILNKMKESEMRFSVDQIVYICKEIAGGLDHAHRCLDGTTGKPLNITHRDMSPQNVMVSFEGEIKIIDFGIAKAETQIETTRAGTLKGKFGYMSPEQAEGQTVDLRTDIFSLGIVLWELLTNSRLFLANNEINTLKKIRNCEIPSLTEQNPEVHSELERIVLKALTKDRNLRYQTAAAFHRDLSRFLNRHYPDFSPHDFSMFVKSLYADEILDLNNQLVEYSKIPFNEVDSTPAPAPTPKATSSTLTGSGPIKKDINVPPANEGGFNLGGVSNKIGKGSGQYNDEETVNNDDDGISLQSQKNKPIDSKDSDIDFNKALSKKPSITPSFSSTSKKNYSLDDFEEKGSSKFMGFAIALSLIPISYLILATILEDVMKPITTTIGSVIQSTGVCGPLGDMGVLDSIEGIGLNKSAICLDTSKLPCPDGKLRKGDFCVAKSDACPRGQLLVRGTCKTTNASKTPGSISLSINSSPSGAEIIINGVSTKRTTPAVIELPAAEPINMTLKKYNYGVHSHPEFVAQNLTSKTITVQLDKILMAYIDIDVQPPRYTNIYVNGKKIESRQLPILRYPVPANETVTVVGENPITRLRTTQKVTLSEGDRKSVILKMKRLPASSK